MLFLGEKGREEQADADAATWTSGHQCWGDWRAVHEDSPITRAGGRLPRRRVMHCPIAYWHRSERYGATGAGTKFAIIGESIRRSWRQACR
jgi:hypothetical protein